MRYTEYDRGSEAIEPIVPQVADPGEQSTNTEKPPATDTGGTADSPPSHLEQISYYTWDVELIEPLVPIMGRHRPETDRR